MTTTRLHSARTNRDARLALSACISIDSLPVLLSLPTGRGITRLVPIGPTPVVVCLFVKEVVVLDKELVDDTLGALLKYQDDIARMRGSEAARLLEEVKLELGSNRVANG